VVDFKELIEEMGQDMTDRIRIDNTWAEGQDCSGLHTAEEIDPHGFRAYWDESFKMIASKADLRATRMRSLLLETF
ncbi:hypothetical protein Tco_0043868, partial [Tanacetum coccineum]